MTRLLLTTCAVLTGLWVQDQPDLSVTPLSAEETVQSQTYDRGNMHLTLASADDGFRAFVFVATYPPEPGAMTDCVTIGLDQEEDV